MDFEDIGRVWREESTGEIRRTRVEDLSASHGRAAKHLNIQTRVGVLASGFMVMVGVPLFARAVWASPHPLVAGAGALLLMSWVVRVVTFWGRLRMSKPNPALPVREAVTIELQRLLKMERFREGIRFSSWAFWAFVIGEILLVAGLMPDIRASAAGLAVWMLVVVCIASLAVKNNRKVLEDTLRPLRLDLESWIADLEKLEDEKDLHGSAQPDPKASG
jgi:hypothetical protein